MTPVTTVFDAFLARITADDWMLEEELELAKQDWLQFLLMATFRFKFPRISLEIVVSEEVVGEETPDPYFVETIGNGEVQLLAIFMKHEWVKRCLASWENIRQLYSDRDFSQANHLDKLIKLELSLREEVVNAEGVYNRVDKHRPSSFFAKLAGKNNG